MSARRKPTRRQIEAAIGVLGWLSVEGGVDGRESDEIGHVIFLLDEELERRSVGEGTQ